MTDEENVFRLPGLNRLEDQAETVDVSAIHAAILREKAEPREGYEPISLWLVTLTGLLLFWGGFYLQRYSGNFQALVYDEKASGLPVVAQPPAGGAGPNLAKGKIVYEASCAACHMGEGQGDPTRQIPPLAGSEWVTNASPHRIIRIVLHGLKDPIQVKGESYPGSLTTMNAWAAVLSDPDIAAVLNYVRNSWGNQAAEVKADNVAAIREKTKAHQDDQWTADELLKIPDNE